MIIDTVLLLATEAKEAAAEGFGINTDILGTKPIFIIILFIVGVAAGIFNVVRSSKMINKG